MAATMTALVNWSAPATIAAIAATAATALGAGMQRLFTLDDRLTLDAIRHIGKRF
jgi:hypothetical protein